ncbi:major facilitator superfamily domain-containing protein [Fennellomyces sp. T-0311]|nr:major facilitator superfamily domain-containing protein [Fennellomyces sp. T-0311]
METAEAHNNTLQPSLSPTDERQKARYRNVMQLLVMFGLQISVFLAALDKTIIATALPTIGSEFQAMPISSWLINSYVLCFNSFQPLFAKFSDIFGRKWTVMSGISMFMLGSLIGGVAKSMIMLIVARGIQGIGAASIMSMAFVIIADLVPLEKQSAYQSLISVVFGIASVTGPFIGGVFTDQVTWRWNFYINLPVGTLSMILIFFTLHLHTEKQKLKEKLMRIDYAGNFLALTASACFLLALNFGGQAFPWKSIPVLFVLTCILVTLFIVVEVRYAKEPLMPPRLFKNRSVVATLFVDLSFGMCFYATIFFLPIFFQAVRGDSAMWSGIRLIPMEVTLAVAAAVSGAFIAKSGIYRSVMIIGVALFASSAGLFSLFSITTNWSMVYGITVIHGIGCGMFLAANSIAILAAVEKSDAAVAIGVREFMASLGGALGVAIASSVLNTALKKNLSSVIPLEYVDRVFHSPEYIRNGLPPVYFDATIEAYAYSMKFVWHIITALGGFGFLSSLFMKHYSLDKDTKPEMTKESDINGQQSSYSIVEVDSGLSSKPKKDQVTVIANEMSVRRPQLIID